MVGGPSEAAEPSVCWYEAKKRERVEEGGGCSTRGVGRDKILVHAASDRRQIMYQEFTEQRGNRACLIPAPLPASFLVCASSKACAASLKKVTREKRVQMTLFVQQCGGNGCSRKDWFDRFV